MSKYFTLFLALAGSSVFAMSPSDFINDKNCDQVINKPIYQVCYNYNYKGATYVAYTVNGDQLSSAEVHIKKRPEFYPENSIPVKYRSLPSDYTRSGYDRGHMANHADFDYSANLVYLTYSMANIVPQDPDVNRKTWVKAEKYERTVAKSLGSVNVINGIKYSSNPERIGRSRVAVPQYFWKMIYNSQKGFQRCFAYNNTSPVDIYSDNLKDHEVDCSKVF